MSTWLLKAENDPLAAIRQFLQDVWHQAGLEGMLVPIYQSGNKTTRTMLLHDPHRLANADPIVPLMQFNTGKLVAELTRQHPDAHFAAVLRACEVRALDELAKSDSLSLKNWLIIGTDCLGCFPAQDFEWRVQKAGGVEQLTRHVYRNARQGGIALDRFRSACRVCDNPEPSHVDLCIDLFGLPVKNSLLIFVQDENLARELDLNQITDGPAPLELILQHKIMLKKIEGRRRRARERQLRELPPGLPAGLDELANFILECQPCRNCAQACPIHAEALMAAIDSGAISRDLARQWLMSCAKCGMCEQACPKEVPLTAIMNRIRREVNVEVVTIEPDEARRETYASAHSN